MTEASLSRGLNNRLQALDAKFEFHRQSRLIVETPVENLTVQQIHSYLSTELDTFTSEDGVFNLRMRSMLAESRRGNHHPLIQVLRARIDKMREEPEEIKSLAKEVSFLEKCIQVLESKTNGTPTQQAATVAA